ncbi:DNA polymerase III subunit alpha, partial [Candidatus Peregrinibacteria bacterium]|nr:DNA polymerase III subunit alpha [Candidatus Peregrinibacteria bacterium]
VPLVVGSASRYCRPEDAEAHDVLLCIQQNAHIDDAGRLSLRDTDFSMRPFAEIENAFSHIPQACENTRKIADRCNVNMEFGSYHIPRFPVPDGKTESEYLRELSEEGLRRRFPNPQPLYEERLRHEIAIIEQMGFSGYFLIVADFINEAKQRGITVGPGRGSVAGSLVSYCLNITTIDPMQHGLIFERFLNPERVTMPDIDTDFADNRRDEILAYVREKYGRDHVIQICTFGTLAARAAVKDVGRAYGMSFLEMNQLAKLIPDRPGTKLRNALETMELRSAYESNDTYRRIIDTALKLEGKARHVSIHACGVIITQEPALHYTALQRAPKDEQTIITQYAAKPLESLGLLKIDFLGLTNLTVIQTTLAIMERTRGEHCEIASIPIDDPQTFALLQRGETTGVFQFESAGMQRYLRQLQPTTFNDITAMAALYRPGPMEWIPSFIKRKHGQEEVTYPHPDLEPIFRETYGIGVYQEQILQLARVFAGFSLGEADLLRRAIGKKIKKELDAQREKFVKGAEKRGYSRSLAERIFDDVITPFAGYGFVKAHAAGYARIAYETAYLKAHYPAEFMAALLSGDAQRTDRIMIEIDECRHMGIKILPPDINESLKHFTVIPPKKAGLPAPSIGPNDGTGSAVSMGEGFGIRFGLSAIKGIGESSVEQIMIERQRDGRFRSIEDFARRLPAKLLNKKTVEALAKSGALDSFGDRRLFVEHHDRIVTYRKLFGDDNSQQSNLFDPSSGESSLPQIAFPQEPPVTREQKLQWEKETLGLYVQSHPLAGLGAYIKKRAQLIGELSADPVGKRVTIVGIPESVKKIRTKKNEVMGVVVLEDPTGKIEVTLFPRTYAETSTFLGEDSALLVVGGTLDVRNNQLQVRAEAVKRLHLPTFIQHAKESGLFNEEEAKHGIAPHRRAESRMEHMELIDDEGNIVAGETVTLKEQGKKEGELGPLGLWILQGMPLENPISIHTILLPARAPKQLLLDLKNVIALFPGKERVQLKIGEQLISLPLTISMSPILERRLADLLQKYAPKNASLASHPSSH